MTDRRWEITDIRRMFEQEFWPVVGKFDFIVLTGDERVASKNLRVARPGVYVHWHDGRVFKVGRSLTNARKRALEHFPADTGGQLAELGLDSESRLILFTVDPQDQHWAAALEVYLEEKLEPVVPSKRKG
jgi:hypothetical protein